MGGGKQKKNPALINSSFTVSQETEYFHPIHSMSSAFVIGKSVICFSFLTQTSKHLSEQLAWAVAGSEECLRFTACVIHRTVCVGSVLCAQSMWRNVYPACISSKNSSMFSSEKEKARGVCGCVLACTVLSTLFPRAQSALLLLDIMERVSLWGRLLGLCW